MEPVRSPRNSRVRNAIRLRRARVRRETGRTLLEGPNLVGEAVAMGAKLTELFGLADDDGARVLAEKSGAEWIPVTAEVLDRMAPTDTPRGPIAVMQIPDSHALVRNIVWLEVTDPGNAGTLIRTAAGFGFDVAVAPNTVDVWSPKVLRSGAGSHFHTAIGQTADLAPDTGRIVSAPSGGVAPGALADLDRKRQWALLVGSEAHGLNVATMSAADLIVTIPMPGGTDSLNAAVAGAILMYEFGRLELGRSPDPR